MKLILVRQAPKSRHCWSTSVLSIAVNSVNAVATDG